MRTVLALSLFILAAALGAWSFKHSAPSPAAVETQGQEEPEPRALYRNGYNVQLPIMDAYQRSEDLLAEPVTAYDGKCQTFRLGRLCHFPGNPPDWQVQWDNLGLAELQTEGYTPKVPS